MKSMAPKVIVTKQREKEIYKKGEDFQHFLKTTSESQTKEKELFGGGGET